MPAEPWPTDATSALAVAEPVTTAFALGWQMARLYTGPLSSNAEPTLDQDLPGLSKLPATSLVTLGLAQADNALAKLGAYLGPEAKLPDTEGVRDQLAADPPDRDAIRHAILALHIALLTSLIAADYRLGTAYGLGRALADTCGSAHGNHDMQKRTLEHHLNPHRALELVGWLDNLKTVLPAHSAQAVADSLQRWARWAEETDLSQLDAKAVSDTTRVLHRCGQRWRALLSGEKAAEDVLEIADYVSAARGTLSSASAIARSLALRLWAPLGLALVLIGVGIWLMVANHSTAQVIAGLGTVAGGLGVTWRSAATTLGHLSLDLGRPLWNAQLDLVVGNRVTPPPQRDYVPGLERPRGHWARAWHELRTPDPDGPRGAPAKSTAGASLDAVDAHGEPDTGVMDSASDRSVDG